MAWQAELVDLAALAELPLTYSEVGATAAAELPAGYEHQHAERQIGTGDQRFEQAADAVMHWGMQRGSGLRVQASSEVVVVDAIVVVLSAIGAHGAVLRLEDVRALKETKNRIHRLVNTETANVVRAASAAAAQRDAIAYLADAYGLRNLSPALREAAQLRLAHPEETLAELGRRASPPVGKATINGRIVALMRLVRRLREPREQEPRTHPA